MPAAGGDAGGGINIGNATAGIQVEIAQPIYESFDAIGRTVVTKGTVIGILKRSCGFEENLDAGGGAFSDFYGDNLEVLDVN